MRQNVFSGGRWEDQMGYSRAVRIGDTIYVAGTTAANPDGTVYAPGDAFEQARRCFEIIDRALQSAGATMRDVVRTRMFVTDITNWEDVGRAHAERFRSVKPAATMLGISALVHPDMLVEIEVEAVLGG